MIRLPRGLLVRPWFPTLVGARSIARSPLPRVCAFSLALGVLLSPTPAEAAVLRGRVLDPAGQPVPNALVVVLLPAGARLEARTGGDGSYVLDRLPGGSLELVVIADGLRAAPRTLMLADDEERVIDVALELAAISESIVVSATQVDALRSDLPAATTIVSRADARRLQLEGIGDALRMVPGLAVAASGGRGGVTSVFPRGGESDYSLVLIDGVRVNTFGGEFDFAHLPVDGIEQVEIVRGPQSALFGSDAIGAVVQIVTRQGGRLSIDGLAETGSQATHRASLSAAGGTGDWQWGAGTEGQASDGYTGLTATGERVSNDDYERGSVSGVVRRLGASGTLLAHGRLARDERGFPGPYGSDPNGTFGGVDTISRGRNRRGDWIVGGSHRLGATSRLRGELGGFDLSSRFASPFGDSRFDSSRLDGRIVGDWSPGTKSDASAGLELMRERADSTFITDTWGTSVPVRRSSLGLFGEWRWRPDRLTLVAGARVERVRRNALAGNDDPFGPRPAFDAFIDASFNPKIAVSYLLSPASSQPAAWTRIRASGGTGMRAPDAFEIAFTDNPSLKAERSRSVDAGIEQGLLDGRLVAEATLFVNRFDDLIVAVGRSFEDASQFRTDNIANARARGLELALRARPSSTLALSIAYTWLSTEVLAVDGGSGQAPPPFAVGDPLIRRPGHQVLAAAMWTGGRASAFVRGGGRSRVLDVDPSFGAFGGKLFNPAYLSIDLGGEITIVRSVRALVRLTNVFDRQYEEVLGFPSLGRQVVVGLRVAASR